MKKRSFRAVSLLLTLVMLLGILPATVFSAAPTLTIRYSTPSATPGTTVQVKVDLEGNSGLSSVRMKVAFDPALTLTDINYNPELGGKSQQPQNYNSPVTLIWLDGTGEFQAAQANFVTLTFQVAENAQTDQLYPLTVTYDPNDIYDKNEQNLDVTIIEGGVNVLACKPGDINKDGTTNMKDATRLFQYLAEWVVDVNEPALDANGDGSVNMKDLTRMLQYLAEWDVELHAGGTSSGKCDHTMAYVAYKAPTCTEPGTAAHWHCSKCGKNYSDEIGTSEMAKVELDKLGHQLIKIPAVEATPDHVGYTEGEKCERCGIVTKEPVEIPKLQLTEYKITYMLFDDDTYLESLGVKNPNPDRYSKEKGLVLQPLYVPDYTFLGWFDGYGDPIREIPAGSTGDRIFYARWEAKSTYTVHFVSDGAALFMDFGKDGRKSEIRKKTNELLVLPEPERQGYEFICWTDRDNNVVTSIKPGSHGEKTVFANWTSLRNQTKPVKKLAKPLIYEDVERGQILFTYEIGQIVNVPLVELQNYGNVLGAGLTWEKTAQESYTVQENHAKTIGDSIADSTSRSAAWTLSDSWSKAVECDVEHQEGVTKETAQQIKDRVEKGSQYNISMENGGSSTFSKNSGSSTSDTTGDTTVSLKEFSNSDNRHVTNTDNGQFDTGVATTVTNKTAIKGTAEVKAGYGPISAKAGVEASNETGFKMDTHANYAAQWSSSDDHEWSSSNHNSDTVGTNNTHVDNSFSNTTESQQCTWNSTKGYSKSQSVSNEESISKALSKMIQDNYHYGTTTGQDQTTTKTTNQTDQATKTRESSTTVEYGTESRKTVSTKITNSGAAAGYYRVVEAGTVHVFAVVGFDIATGSYYTYTYNLVDKDDRYEFFDFSEHDPSFNDNENGVLSFEVPAEIHSIVSDVMVRTQGLTIDSTGMVTAYKGDSQVVVIPDYISVDRGNGAVAVQVKGIKSGVFTENKNVKAVKLGRYITTLPDAAFLNCTGLETLVAPGLQSIGMDAFAGCTSLKEFGIGLQVTELGENAFADVGSLIVKASNKAVAEAAMRSGAKKIDLDISQMTDAFENVGELQTIQIPEGTSYFALRGDPAVKTFLKNVKLVSDADETVLQNLSFETNDAVVLELASDLVSLGYTDVQTNAVALLLKSPSATVRVRDICYLNTTGDCVMLTRSASYVDAGGGVGSRIYMGNDKLIKVAGTHSDPAGLLDGRVQSISEEEFNGVLTSHKLMFHAEGGTVTPESMVVAYGKPVGVLPIPEKKHFTFCGWWTEPNGRGIEYNASSIFKSLTDLDLYASWTDKEYYLTFDYNGGNKGQAQKPVKGNQKVGWLPEPDRDYYDFAGWYTAKEGGTQVTPDTVCQGSQTLYAHWNQHGSSDWVLAGSMPSGAQKLEEKWTYTKRTNTESRETSLAGYTQYGSYWQSSTSGNKYYASFPSGYDHGNQYYQDFSLSPYSASETATTKRTVSNSWAGYIYWHWMYDCGGSRAGDRLINDRKEINYFNYKYFGAFTSSTNYPRTGGSGDKDYRTDEAHWTYWKTGRTSYASSQGSDYWYRFSYYNSSYVDYYKVFKYYKLTTEESRSAVSNSDTISNVQHWVKYRAK